jgi:diaminopimelate decarboxylase
MAAGLSAHPLHYAGDRLHLEAVDLEAVAAACGTPCYVYSRAAIESAYHGFVAALSPLRASVCYAVKANHNLAVLALLARLGAHFDIVSGGELGRVLAAGGAAAHSVFSGVGKRQDEVEQALAAGIGCFNVESEAELAAIAAAAAAAGVRAPVAVRVNPDIDARTHPHISTGLSRNKFGIAIAGAPALCAGIAASPQLRLRGIACHIGSQITEMAPLLAAYGSLLDLVDRLAAAGIDVEHVDLGGGLGIRYRDEAPIDLADWGAAVRRLFAGRDLAVHVEPGRRVVAAAGALLTRTLYVKENGALRFAVVDAAMNDLLRPALYDAWHDILPLRAGAAPARPTEVVGPVCESADVLGHARPLAAEAGTLLAIADAGAYGFVMSSNYNARPRAAEVLVDGDRFAVVRRRETLQDQLALECAWPPR